MGITSVHLEQEVFTRENKIAYGTVAVVDMVGYSTLARMLEENMGTGTVADLNRQIQDFVHSALRNLSGPTGYTKITETGDGAILIFDAAHDAHLFAEQLHLNAAKHNRSRNESSAMRWFRIGIATGELNREKLVLEKDKYSGITIANAVRLETAAESGEIVVDIETFGILPKEDRISYGPETTISGKREETFAVRRYKVVNPTHLPGPEVKQTSRNRLLKLGANAAAFATALVTLFLAMQHLARPSQSPSDMPVLQSVQAKPNLVKKGDTVTITVIIDRPAPKNGVKINLSSDDPSILTVDGSATVYQGYTSGTAYSRALSVPNYLYPINVVATYNGDSVRTPVSVAGQVRLTPESQPDRSTNSVGHGRDKMTPANPSAQSPVSDSSSKRVPINPELVSRLEEVQGRLSSELAYWEMTKKQMLPGTSLRPEITSQIYAAKSASQRCGDEVKASDAVSLGPCIDSLNDHLSRLNLLH